MISKADFLRLEGKPDFHFTYVQEMSAISRNMNLEPKSSMGDALQRSSVGSSDQLAKPSTKSTKSTIDYPHQEKLRHLVQQGDTEALTELINPYLQAHSLQVADLAFKAEGLQLSVEGADVPEQSQVVALVRDYLSQLRLPSLKTVTLYGQKLGQELPFWMEQIELDLLIMDSEPALATPSGDGDLEQVSLPPRPDLTALPSEIALKLTQQYEAGERNFAGINLKDEALPGINLTLADLQEANLVWCNLQKASLSHANLTSAQVRHADLTNANLQGAKLQGTDLQGAKLQGANLSWATLRGTNLTDADLTDVNLKNATLERVIMPDGTILD